MAGGGHGPHPSFWLADEATVSPTTAHLARAKRFPNHAAADRAVSDFIKDLGRSTQAWRSHRISTKTVVSLASDETSSPPIRALMATAGGSNDARDRSGENPLAG